MEVNRLGDGHTDHLKHHKARLSKERNIAGAEGTRVRVAGCNVFFERQDPGQLRQLVNNGVDSALKFLTDNLRRSQRRSIVSQHQIEELSIRLSLNHLYLYNLWKHAYLEYQDHDLALTFDDGDRMGTR